ncbi:MAG: type II toxin-antitoxin system YafQ family toxin [Treponema sp.]|jgi:mRNA interferase YafQ|nr:type II toxin-antitoxin system YafQ family toxin [Treponema sp.]
MLDYEISGPFSKNLKLMEKRHKDIPKLREVMQMLIQEIPLLPRHENHPLHGKYQGWWGCHVEPNWVLVYRIDTANRKVIFYRTGSHSDLY